MTLFKKLNNVFILATLLSSTGVQQENFFSSTTNIYFLQPINIICNIHNISFAMRNLFHGEWLVMKKECFNCWTKTDFAAGSVSCPGLPVGEVLILDIFPFNNDKVD